MGGLQAQYAPAMYLGLWCRMAGTATGTRSPRRSSQQAGGPGHADALDHPPCLDRRTTGRSPWLSGQSRGTGFAACPGPTPRTRRDGRGAADTLRRHLRDGRSAAPGRARQADHRPAAQRGVGLLAGPGSGAAVGHLGAASGRPVRLSADLWLGASREPTRTSALDLLVRRYLAGFGPSAGPRSPTGPAFRSPPWPARSTGAGAAPVPGRGRHHAGRPAPGAASERGSPRFPYGSCRCGTQPCWSTPGGPGSCPSGTGHGSSTPAHRTRSTPSWSTGRWRARGGSSTTRSGWTEFAPLDAAVRRELAAERPTALAAFHR